MSDFLLAVIVQGFLNIVLIVSIVAIQERLTRLEQKPKEKS